MAKIEDMWLSPSPRPNGLQATADGLWVIDAGNNHLYLLDHKDGSVLVDVPTETYKSSGVAVGGGNVWVASTHSSRVYKLDEDGSTVKYWTSPGDGVLDARDKGPEYVRPHGMEWVDGKMWVVAKPALQIYLVDPETMEVERSIPTPGAAPHGIALDGNAIWCGDRAMAVIHKLSLEDGEVLDEIPVPAPEVHGVTIHDGALIMCCDPSRRICRIPLP